jgi:L-iditol 2-dehydrogenase/threonine 3-dehydrogenase
MAHAVNASRESLRDAAVRVFGGVGFDLAFEAAGAEATMAAVLDAIKKGGRVVVLGVFGEKPRVNMAVVTEWELSLIGTLMYKHEDYIKAVELIAGGQVITGPLVTKHFPFEKYTDAYRFIDEQGDKTLKVMIDL